MPKNKRAKKVSLTKTKKRGQQRKEILLEEIRNDINKYKNIFIFSYTNLNNKFLHEIRLNWRDSRIYFCNNRVMAIALGRTRNEEIKENLSLMSEKLVGDRGVLFTNASKKEVLRYFDSYQQPDFARTGNIAIETFEIPEGPLPQFSHSLEPYLRKLGLPVMMKSGVPTMWQSFTVCNEGDVLQPSQAKLLKFFEQKKYFCKLVIEFCWSSDGSFEDLNRATNLPILKKIKVDRKLKTDKNKKPEKDDKDENSNFDKMEDEGVEADCLSDSMEEIESDNGEGNHNSVLTSNHGS